MDSDMFCDVQYLHNLVIVSFEKEQSLGVICVTRTVFMYEWNRLCL